MTTRLTALDPAQATGKAKELLDGVQASLGLTPNLMRTMAQSPAVLEGYLSLSGALGHGTLPAKVREQISLAVGEANHCQYCVSAHTAIGKMVGLNADDILSSRNAQGSDPKATAALTFAHLLVQNRGEATDAEISAVRAAGYTEGEVAEIVANVALNLFTNYFNHVARTEVDFPKVELLAKA